MNLDKDVKEFHRISDIETDLYFKGFDEMKKGNGFLEQTWPDPSAEKLWFIGLKKHGQKFADREYELSPRAKLDSDK